VGRTGGPHTALQALLTYAGRYPIPCGDESTVLSVPSPRSTVLVPRDGTVFYIRDDKRSKEKLQTLRPGSYSFGPSVLFSERRSLLTNDSSPSPSSSLRSEICCP
jgi:hypothetical protein